MFLISSCWVSALLPLKALCIIALIIAFVAVFHCAFLFKTNPVPYCPTVQVGLDKYARSKGVKDHQKIEQTVIFVLKPRDIWQWLLEDPVLSKYL